MPVKAEKNISPYKGLPRSRYWKSGVSGNHITQLPDLYKKKFDITRDHKVVTAGSCFAQHIARNLRQRDYTVLDYEQYPFTLDTAIANKYGFGLYSARYGNIYTARQLLQLYTESLGNFNPENPIWEKSNRFYDAFRPNVEPKGLESKEMVTASRISHLRKVRKVFHNADIFVFTFGLTEAWEHIESGTVYPTAPGTIAGSFNPDIYKFTNFNFSQIYNDFVKFRRILKSKNPNVKFLITVSPVPLVATAEEKNVMVATMYSKSVLRGVAGQLADTFEDIDYFPSYDFIMSHVSKGFFFEPNMRNISAHGVKSVMEIFFEEHDSTIQEDGTRNKVTKSNPINPNKEVKNVICDLELIEAFGA